MAASENTAKAELVRPGRVGDKRSSIHSPVVVVPTYNESENLLRLLQALRSRFPAASILVVDDNSPDGTGEIADEVASKDQCVHVLHRKNKGGLGAAYLAGFQVAIDRGHDAIVQMDADFSHNPDRAQTLIAGLRDADVAIGSRYVSGGEAVGWGIGRKVLSLGGSTYARWILGVPYRDLTGGFKAWRVEVLKTIGTDKIRSKGFCFQIEMTYRAHKAGSKIIEIPITFEDRTLGESKMDRNIAWEAVRLCWWLRRNVK